MDEKRALLGGAALSKDFAVRVLDGVDLTLRAGEVHALIGENGAGKSTLLKILAGYEQPSAGEVLVDGVPTHLADSAAGEARGIVLIHQEFNLAEQLSVAANIFLGRELRRGLLLDVKAMRERSRRAARRTRNTGRSGPEDFRRCRCRSGRWSRSPRRWCATPASSSWTSRPRC